MLVPHKGIEVPDLSALHFHDEQAAYAYVEACVWPDGPVCPRCGSLERVEKCQGHSPNPGGTYKCSRCRKPFNVKIGTIFQGSKVPMHLWLQAMILIGDSRNRVSLNRLHHILGVTRKTAWLMSLRIRAATSSNDISGFGSEAGALNHDAPVLDWQQDGRQKRLTTPTR